MLVAACVLFREFLPRIFRPRRGGKMRGKSPFDVFGGKLNYNFFCWQMFFFIFLLLVIWARKSNARQIDNGIDENAQPRVYCFRNGLKIKIATLKPFTGVLYVKGMAGNVLCNKNFSGETTNPGIAIAYEDCIHQRERLAKPPGMTFMVTIVTQFHPFFTTSIDRAFIVTCTYREAINTVTNRQILQGHVGATGPNGEPIGGAGGDGSGSDSDSIPTSRLNYTPVLPLCKYTIHRGSPKGPVISYARVGEKTFHKWQCYPSSDGEFHGLLVHNCVARAGNGIQIKLLDKKGCTLDPFAMGTPKYARNLTLAYVEVHAFKFADDLQISFSCSVSLCLRMNNRCQGITPPNCTVAKPNNGRGSGGYGNGNNNRGGNGNNNRGGGNQQRGGGYGNNQGSSGNRGGGSGYGSNNNRGGNSGFPSPGYPPASGPPPGQRGGGGGYGLPGPPAPQPPIGGFPAVAILPPDPPAPPPGHNGAGSGTYYPPGFSNNNQQSFPPFPGAGHPQLIGGQIRPPAPPISGSYAILSDSVVEDYEDSEQSKRSPISENIVEAGSFQDSVSFQGDLNPLNQSNSVALRPSADSHDTQPAQAKETEGFGYVSFGTELSAPSLSLIDLPNLPPLPPEELEFLKEIQRDARELGRSVSHHRMPGEPQENPNEMDQVSDASIDISAEDFIVFDRKTEIPELLVAQDREFSDGYNEYEETSCQPSQSGDYCVSRLVFVQVLVAVSLSFACLSCLSLIFWVRSRRRSKESSSNPPVLTYHYDNMSCSGESTLPRNRSHRNRTYDEPNFQL